MKKKIQVRSQHTHTQTVKKKGKEGELGRERKPTVPTVPGVTTVTSFLLAGESTGWRTESFIS